jgi:hypothetical protein
VGHLEGTDELVLATQRLRQGLIRLRCSVLDQLGSAESDRP